MIEGVNISGAIFVSSLDPGVEIASEKSFIEVGDTIHIEYGEIDQEKIPRVWAYIIEIE